MSVNYLECKKGNLIIRKRDQGSFIMEIIVPETYFKTQQGESIVIAIENKKEIIYSLGLIMPNFKTDAHFSSEDDFLLDPKDLILYSHWFYKSKRYFELLENN